MQMLKKSMIDVYKDTKYIIKLKKEKKKVSNFNLKEYVLWKSITYDLVKFIPYSILMTIPFLEFFIPIYVILFPNSVPS